MLIRRKLAIVVPQYSLELVKRGRPKHPSEYLTRNINAQYGSRWDNDDHEDGSPLRPHFYCNLGQNEILKFY